MYNAHKLASVAQRYEERQDLRGMAREAIRIVSFALNAAESPVEVQECEQTLTVIYRIVAQAYIGNNTAKGLTELSRYLRRVALLESVAQEPRPE